MRYPVELVHATLLRRYKRFLADVSLEDGREVTVHVPNSGTMKTCMVQGGPVLISPADNPKRKLKWTLEQTFAGPEGATHTGSRKGSRVMVNTQLPNKLVREGIEMGLIERLAGYESLRTEVKYGSRNSRIDLLLSGQGKPPCWVEVKNATLIAEEGMVRFPDAVTKRGQKHLLELAEMAEQGHRAVIFYLASRTDARAVGPADGIDPEYGRLLREVVGRGVEAMAHGLHISNTSLVVGRELPVVLT
jgi:sugar fermentation stimulation protein A